MAQPNCDLPVRLTHEFGRLLEDALNEVFILEASRLTILFANRGARENLGYSPEEVEDHALVDLLPEFTPDSLEVLISPLREGQETTLNFRTRLRRKGGSEYTVDLRLQEALFCDARAFIVMRIAGEEEKREREIQLRAILDTACEGIITIDEQGICESFNAAAEAMFGYTAEEVIGHNVSMLMPSPYRAEHNGYLAHYLSTGEKKIIGSGRDTVGRRRNGEEFPIHLAVSEVQLKDRRLFTGLIQDITERNEAQRRLVQSERLAAVGEAMARLAHESRNFLQRIHIAVETARLYCGENAPWAAQLESIEKSSDSLDALLDELKNYAAPLNLEKTQTSLVAMWREAWQATLPVRSGRAATLQEELCDEKVLCEVDRFRVVQVFRNLFENSLSACQDPAEIKISVSAPQEHGSQVWQICVCDNGPGLNEEQTRRIFEPFFTTKTKGTGLGMAIAQRVVEAHEGTISVEPTDRAGAKFMIRLPW